MPAAPTIDPVSTTRGDSAELAARLANVFGTRFQVLGPVAIGGMATIFQLKHRLHGGLFAAKVLHAELAGRPGVVRSFRQEARHAALLGVHPNAVPIFDFGELDGLFYMLMPFIEGEDLDRILAGAGMFSRDETLQMVAQVSSVLAAAERHGITHCDLTPGNLRLDCYGFYRLLDFGISISDAAEPAPFTGGTPLYTSPERIEGKPASLCGDLYSLGAIAVEALTGRPAFDAGSLDAIRQRHLTGDWHPPASLAADDPFLALLRRMLAVDPAGRPQSAFELSGMLDACGYPRPEFRRSAGRRAPARENATASRRRLS